jgi:hypothetical protein
VEITYINIKLIFFSDPESSFQRCNMFYINNMKYIQAKEEEDIIEEVIKKKYLKTITYLLIYFDYFHMCE